MNVKVFIALYGIVALFVRKDMKHSFLDHDFYNKVWI